MSGFGLGIVVLAALVASGFLVASLLRIKPVAQVVLATYTVVYAEIVGLSLFLSPFGGLTRSNLVAGSLAVLAAVGAIWVIAGFPRAARMKPACSWSQSQGASAAPVVLLATVVAVGLAYVVALIVGTPPNGWDPLNYHLPRAAFWLQSHRIGYIEPAYDERLNFNPPNGEIGLAFVLAVTRNEMFVGFVQFFAALACGVGVYALARRLELSRLESTFGGLLFLSLPIVLLQASLSKNDLVVASFLVAATVFVVGNRRRDVGLAAVATALAVGTKSTAAYGFVVLLGLGLFLRRPPGRLIRVTGIVLGAIAGSYWYLVNAVETGHLLGDQSAVESVTAPFHGAENVVTGYGMLVDTFDVSGARGRDILLYGILALLTAGSMLVLSGGWATWKRAALAAAIVASPFLLLAVSEHIGRPSLVSLYDALGKPEGFLGEGSVASPTVASDTASWFGPVGFLCMLGAIVATAGRARGHLPARESRALAVAPVGWFLLLALTLTYNPWLGRFFIFPIAISAAVWGVIARWPPAAWATAVLGAVTIILVLVHYVEKPSGIRLLDRTHVASVWTMKRWEVQSQHDPPLGPLLRFLDEQVPAKASVALALGDNDFGYPAFGPHLERRVVLVPPGSTARDIRVDWLVTNSERAGEIDRSCWAEAFRSSEGSVFRRSASCA